MTDQRQITIQTDDPQLSEVLSSMEAFRKVGSPHSTERGSDIAFGARGKFGPLEFEIGLAEFLGVLRDAPPAFVDGLFSALKRAISGAREVRILFENKPITVEQLERARIYKDFDPSLVALP